MRRGRFHRAARALAGRVTGLGRGGKAAILLALDAASGGAAGLLALTGQATEQAMGQAGPTPAPLLVVAGLGVLVAAGSALMGLHRMRLAHFAARGLARSLFPGLLAGLVLWPLAGPRAALTGAGLCVSGAMAGRQALLALARRAHASARPPVRLLIWGAGRGGEQLAAALAGDERHRVLGFLDDDPRKQGPRNAGLMVHAPARAAALVARHRIDCIVLALPRGSRMAATRALAGLDCEVLSLPGFAARLWGGADGPPDIARLLGRAGLDRALPETRESYAGQSVLVTGAGGSIGAELCRQLLRLAPARLVLLDHSEFALYAITRELEEAGCPAALVPVPGSVGDAGLVADLLRRHRVDTIFHAAAYKHVPMVQRNPLEGIRNNVFGTRILADAAAAAGVARFILVSTDKAVRPTSVMGATKRLAEEVVQDRATRATATRFAMVRFGNVMGSSGSVIPLFAEQIARGGPVTVTDPRVTRYFMTGAEAVRLTLLAGAWARSGDLFVLDMGAPQSILDLARRMIRGAGLVPCEPGDPGHRESGAAPARRDDAGTPDPGGAGRIEIRFTGLRPGEKLTEELLIGADMLTTPHPRILRAREGHLSQIEVAAALAELQQALDARDAAQALAALSRWVTTDRTAAAAHGRG